MRKPRVCLLPQTGIAAARSVFSRAVIHSPEQKKVAVISEGIAACFRADKHAVDLHGVLQCQHIRSLLMHSRKIHAGEIDKRIMTGKDDVLCLYRAVIRCQPVVFHGADGGVLENSQTVGQCREEFQRMELRLMSESDRTRRRNRQGKLGHKCGRKAQSGCGLRLGAQLLFVGSVDIRAALLQIAVDALGSDERSIFLYRRFIGEGILPCGRFPQRFHQLVINHAVLRGDLCRGIARLSARNPVRLQNHNLMTGFLQFVRDQNACHAGADDRNFAVDILLQGRPFPNRAELRPD